MVNVFIIVISFSSNGEWNKWNDYPALFFIRVALIKITEMKYSYFNCKNYYN